MVDTSKIKLVLLDVDGTMTDGGVYVTEEGKQFKKFNAKRKFKAAVSTVMAAQKLTSLGLEFKKHLD